MFCCVALGRGKKPSDHAPPPLPQWPRRDPAYNLKLSVQRYRHGHSSVLRDVAAKWDLALVTASQPPPPTTGSPPAQFCGGSAMLTSRLAWLVLRLGCKMGVFDSVWHWTIRVLVRVLQFALCLASLILLSTGFVVGSFQGRSTMLGSRYVLVTALLAFLGLVYAFWWALFIEILHLSERPRGLYTGSMDLIIALALLAAAIVLLLSDFVHNCLAFGHFLRCYNLNASVVLLFVSAGSFLLTPWLERRWSRQHDHARHAQEPEAETPRHEYRPATTPAAGEATHASKATPEERV